MTLLILGTIITGVTVTAYGLLPGMVAKEPGAAVFAVLLAAAYFVYLLFETVQTYRKSTEVTVFVAHVALSATMTIFASAMIYRNFGLDDCLVPKPGEALYFSAVAFSTLGFGDLAPAPGVSRGIAAAEALVGNLHLALLAACAFFLLTRVVEEETDLDALLGAYDQRIAQRHDEVARLDEAVKVAKTELAELRATIQEMSGDGDGEDK